MGEYIKREDAERAIEEDFRHACHPYEWMGLEDALDDLSRVPSADVVEVRHGRWLKHYECCDAFVCSECGAPSIVVKKYCCECGARMDEEEQEHE